MTDEEDKMDTPTTTPTPVHRKKRRLPPRPAHVVVEPVSPRQSASAMPAEFAGLSLTECCDGCGPDGCLITKGGSGICGHPRKGGLQAADMIRPEVFKRYEKIKRALGHL